ncbi:peptidase M23, partial [bacterium]|nr:peptidase M23 [bacterium]
MIRIFIVFLFLCAHVYAKSDVDQKITSASGKLSSFSKSYSSISEKMNENAKAILKQKQEIQVQEKYLEKLIQELSEKENSHKENISQMQELKIEQRKLKKDQEEIEQELVFTIAKSVSLSVVLEEQYAVNADSIIEFEVLKSMLQSSKDKAKQLNQKFYANSKDINVLDTYVNSLEVSIANIDAKRKDLLRTHEKNKKSLNNLEIAKLSYKDELKKLLIKQDALKKTLAELNIIKIDEIRKAKEEDERKVAFSSQQSVSDTDLPQVVKHGSSYQAIKTKKYYGIKTIAPLDYYDITKDYGTYTDPIYGIKIFN